MVPKKLNPQQQEAIASALDEIMVGYEGDKNVIFEAESERAKLHFEGVSRRARDWKKLGRCMVPGCARKSIKRSHGIPKGMSLTLIAENGTVLTPFFDQSSGQLGVKHVGVAEASTFPGFCSDHERLFESFETKKKIETKTHVYLQTYRAACREFFRTEFHIKQTKDVLAKYTNLRDRRLAERVAKAINARGLHDIKVDNLSIGSDPVVEEANRRIAMLVTHYENFRNRLLPALERSVFQSDESDIFIKAVDIDLELPVALSGSSVFHIDGEGKAKDVCLIFGVLPSTGHSLLTFAGHANDKVYIQTYIAHWMKNVFRMLAMVESWMVNGTDQWYLRPSVWEGLPQTRQEGILDAILRCKQNIGQEYEKSIFDTIRKNQLAALRTEKPTEYLHFADAVRSEMKKMA